MLEEEGILDQIERVAGTSSGALTATLISFRLSVAETVALAGTLDYSLVRSAVAPDVMDNPVGNAIGDAIRNMAAGISNSLGVDDEVDDEINDDEEKPATTTHARKQQYDAVARATEQNVWPQIANNKAAGPLGNVLADLNSVTRLVNQFGWYANEHSYNWMQGLIAERCGDAHATFADFQRLRLRDLHVVATNMSRKRTEVFNAANTPDVAVADALLLSQSIPLFFEAPRFDGKTLGRGDTYTDGGVLNNFPLQVFDDIQYVADKDNYVDEINWETLGCRTYTPDDCEGPAEVTNLVEYVVQLFLTLNASEGVAYANNVNSQRRSVEISNCCVEPTDFDLQPTREDERYQALLAAGVSAMRDYLANYVPVQQRVG